MLDHPGFWPVYSVMAILTFFALLKWKRIYLWRGNYDKTDGAVYILNVFTNVYLAVVALFLWYVALPLMAVQLICMKAVDRLYEWSNGGTK